MSYKDKREMGDNADMDYTLKTLAETIARWAGESQSVTTAIPELSLHRHTASTEPANALYDPSVCVVAQGAKRVLFGDGDYIYDARSYLLTSVNIPTLFQVVSASPREPYLGLVLRLNMREVSQLIVDTDFPALRTQQSEPGMVLGKISSPLLTAIHRLVQLLDEPHDIPILAPIYQKEILYRLLMGDQGERLRQIAAVGSQSNQIARAIDWLKENYAQQLKIDDLAMRVNMSPSTFHHHFKALTAKSPLQYQKWLRLNEARRLMLIEQTDAATASFEVGYESPSQFSREYSRLFGNSPARDISILREETLGGAIH
jgi:AraC-like DNA-binding protein